MRLISIKIINYRHPTKILKQNNDASTASESGFFFKAENSPYPKGAAQNCPLGNIKGDFKALP